VDYFHCDEAARKMDRGRILTELRHGRPTPRHCYNLDHMAKVVQAAEFFMVGGPVPPDRLSYVERAADRELESALRARNLCYVLGARGTGKTSLLGRAARALRQSGELVAIVDLASLEARGDDGDVDRWSYAVAHRVAHELKLRVDLSGWWRERTAVSRDTRLADFFWDVVLTNTTSGIVILFDEIERAVELPFGRELLAAIDACYARRAREPDYSRLTFAFAGVASREQLASRAAPGHAPAVAIEATDFTPEEASTLAVGFGGERPQTLALMERVCVWTNGHPHLTQRVARGVERKGGKLEDVEHVVQGELLAPRALHEEPLAWVREALTARRPAARRALGTLRRVARGAKVAPPADSAVRDVLLLSGVAVVTNGVLGYRNRIVREAFGARWIKSVAPLGWRTVAVAAAVVALVALAGFAYWHYLPLYYERVLVDPNANTAALDAAHDGLHRLPGFAARADDLLADALRRRSTDATNVGALVTTDTALRALPGQAQVADRLLADFWLRKTAAAAAAEQRDSALLLALRAALAGGGGAEEARAWVGALVGDDYAELSRTFELADAPERWGVDWQAGLLLAVEPAQGILRTPLAASVKTVAEAPIQLSALAYTPLERALRVEEEGAAGELELSVAVAHPASAELTLALTAPSGTTATVPVPQSQGGKGENFVFAAQPGTPLAALADEERHGTWKLALIDRREGNVGSLAGWGLRFGEQSVRDDPEQPVAIPDPARTTAVTFDVSDDDRFAIVRPAAPGPAPTLALWDLGAGRPRADFDLPRPAEHALVNAAQTRVLAWVGDQVSLWNAATGARVARLATQTEFVLPPVFSADGGYLAIAERVDEAPPLLSLLRAEDGALLASVAGASRADRWWLAPGGRYFALLEPNNVVQVIDARRGTELASLPHERAVAAVLPLPDGVTLLTIDEAGEIRAWTFDPKAPAAARARPLGTTASTSGVSLSADGSRLAYPMRGGEFVVRAVASGARVASVRMNDASGSPRARLSPDGGRLVTSSAQHFRVWSLPSATDPAPSAERAADLSVSALAIDAASDGIAFGQRDGGVSFGDAGDPARRAKLLDGAGDGGPHASVRALAVSGSAALVASGADDGVVRLAALSGSSPLGTDPLRSFDAGDGPVAAVALGADGRLVAAATKSSVHVWNAADGTVVLTIPRAAETVALAPGGELLATGGGDGAVQVWRRGEAIGGARTLPSPVRWVGFGSDEVLLVATDRWLHSFSVAAHGLEPLHAWPAPGSPSAARGFAALGAERMRIEGFDSRGDLRRSEIDLAGAHGGAVAAAPEVLSRDWAAVLGLEIDDAGELIPAGR
jgi:WD40 repeat protein/subtilisin-like proprotein convertase family protein